MTGKFGANAHPSVNESNTHTDGELLSPGFREGVGRLKLAIRLAALAQGDLDIGTLWAALHEVAVETLESDKGKEQAEVYWSKIREFADWQLTQPVSGSSPGAQARAFKRQAEDGLWEVVSASTGDVLNWMETEAEADEAVSIFNKE